MTDQLSLQEELQLILVSDEDIADEKTLDEYNKLNEKCDEVIDKVKARKNKNKLDK
jgi:hypothetical protein